MFKYTKITFVFFLTILFLFSAIFSGFNMETFRSCYIVTCTIFLFEILKDK